MFGDQHISHSSCKSASFRLDEDSINWKLAYANRIPGKDIQQEILQLINMQGMDWFNTETLVNVSELNSLDYVATSPTGY